MARERMSGVDTAWLRMDSPGNLMMIVGVEVLDAPIGHRELCRFLQERLLRFERFRQKVEEDATGHWWVDDPDFRIERHVLRARLRGRDRDAALKELVGRLASEPLDPAHPLWQFHLLERYGGGSAVIIRIHHCIADGIALVRVMLSLSDAAAAAPSAGPGAGEAQPAAARGAEHDDEPHDLATLLGAMWEPVAHAAASAAGSAGHTLARSIDIAGSLATDGDARGALATVGVQVASDALKIALMSEDSATRLKGKPGGRKAVAWNEPMPLDEVRTVCKAMGVSVNDVLLSCVAGAVQRYLEAHGEYTSGKEIRAMVPVNLRPADEPLRLGNRFGLVPLTLPVGIANPLERLFDVRRRMNELKAGYQGQIAFALLNAMGYAPRALQALLFDYLAHKATAVMTNVPGPRAGIELFGRRLARAMFWVPQSGDIGVGVSILSYDGSVQFGLVTDTALCADPQRVVDGFQTEFERLVLTLSMLPRELVQHGLVDAVELERRLFSGAGGGRRRARAQRDSGMRAVRPSARTARSSDAAARRQR